MGLKKEIYYKNIGEITPYENNPRKNEAAVKYVAESIKQFNFQNPIIIDKNNVIVCGHTRYKAAQELGLEEVPCLVADDLTEEQIKAFRLADNKVGEISEWDLDLLAEELEGITELDMSEFAFDLDAEKEDKPERKDLSEEVGEMYQIVVECQNETEQERLYNKFVGDGLSCRTLIL